MENSRLIEVWRRLDRKSIRDLGKFVASPYHNQRQDVRDLYDYLASLPGHLPSAKISKARIYPILYGRLAYEEKKICYAMSFLYQVIKSFLAYRAFEEETWQSQVYLSRAFKKMGLNRQFETEIKDMGKKLEQQPLRDVNYHYLNYQMRLEESDYRISQKRAGAESFQAVSDEFNVFFIANRLRLSCSAVSHRAFSQTQYENDLLEEVLALVEQGDYLEIPAIALYYYIYKSMTEIGSENYFQQLKSVLHRHQACFQGKELRDIYIMIINNGIRQFNQGQKWYMQEVFELYKAGLQLGIFIENGILSPFTYKNIVTAGLILKEFDWVAEFLETYKSYINAKDRESVFNYNLAILYYRKPDYPQAMKLLRSIEFSDVLHDLDARRMLLKMYYELKEFSPLESLLISFRTFIYRHKELGYHKTNYLNLIRYTDKLLSLDFYDKAKVQKLREEIERTEALAEKNWLLGQLA
ncbi:MAG: hypothetical protein AAFP19_05620 [Bacteroidota bacterium]